MEIYIQRETEMYEETQSHLNLQSETTTTNRTKELRQQTNQLLPKHLANVTTTSRHTAAPSYFLRTTSEVSSGALLAFPPPSHEKARAYEGFDLLRVTFPT